MMFRVIGRLGGWRRGALVAALLVIPALVGVWGAVRCDSTPDNVRSAVVQAPRATPTAIAQADSSYVDVPTPSPTTVLPTPTAVTRTPTPTVVTRTPAPTVVRPTPTPRVVFEVVAEDGPNFGSYQGCHTSTFRGGSRHGYDVVAWSPDGSELYFTRGGDVYGVTADGWQLWPLSEVLPQAMAGGRRWTSFAVDPDGVHLVYADCRLLPASFTLADGTRVVRDRDLYGFELLRVSRHAAGAERLTENASFDFYPAWSPDGRRIAFLSDAGRTDADTSGQRLSLFTMSADGTDVRSVLDDEFMVLHQPPQWSPDGRHLAVVRYREVEIGWAVQISKGGRELWVVGSDGTGPQRLAGDVVSSPSWSPGSRRLAYARADDDGVALFTVRTDGTGETRVSGIPGWQGPRWRPEYTQPDPAEAWIDIVAWSPDGTRILVGSNRRHPAFIVNLESGSTTELKKNLQRQLPLEGFRAAAWSPDGSRIALLAHGQSHRGPDIVATMAADGTDLRVQAEREEPLYPDSKLLPQQGRYVPGPGEVEACEARDTVRTRPANHQLVQQCVALIAMQQSLVGGEALNWSPERPMAEWDGVVVGGTPLQVQALNLHGRSLRGALRLGFPWLYYGLHTLVLRDNDLDGHIPRVFGHFEDLEILDLSNNQFTGTIPSELGRLAKLRTLDLSSNQLSGDIPARLAELPNLQDVALAGNQFTGCVPPGLPLRDPDALDLPICEPAA